MIEGEERKKARECVWAGRVQPFQPMRLPLIYSLSYLGQLRQGGRQSYPTLHCNNNSWNQLLAFLPIEKREGEMISISWGLFSYQWFQAMSNHTVYVLKLIFKMSWTYGEGHHHKVSLPKFEFFIWIIYLSVRQHAIYISRRGRRSVAKGILWAGWNDLKKTFLLRS